MAVFSGGSGGNQLLCGSNVPTAKFSPRMKNQMLQQSTSADQRQLVYRYVCCAGGRYAFFIDFTPTTAAHVVFGHLDAHVSPDMQADLLVPPAAFLDVYLHLAGCPL
jgi:hypothetical protein